MVFQAVSIVLAASLGAALTFAQPVKSSPLSPENRGDILMARKMYREAIETFGEGPPNDAILRNKTGIAYHQLMQLDSARRSYEQAVKLKPDYAEAINNLGTIYYAKKSYRRAIGYYKRALKITPLSASIHSNLGTAYWARKQYPQAMESLQTAIKLDPNVFEHHSSYGVLLQERSVEDRAKFHFWMATLYAKDGRSELAIQYLRKALEEGFKERKKLIEDPAFAAMRELPEFKVLLTLEPRVL